MKVWLRHCSQCLYSVSSFAGDFSVATDFSVTSDFSVDSVSDNFISEYFYCYHNIIDVGDYVNWWWINFIYLIC